MQNASLHGGDNDNYDYLKDERDDGGGWEEVDKINIDTHTHIHTYIPTHTHYNNYSIYTFY
jgi:hypothetical protein